MKLGALAVLFFFGVSALATKSSFECGGVLPFATFQMKVESDFGKPKEVEEVASKDGKATETAFRYLGPAKITFDFKGVDGKPLPTVRNVVKGTAESTRWVTRSNKDNSILRQNVSYSFRPKQNLMDFQTEGKQLIQSMSRKEISQERFDTLYQELADKHLNAESLFTKTYGVAKLDLFLADKRGRFVPMLSLRDYRVFSRPFSIILNCKGTETLLDKSSLIEG